MKATSHPRRRLAVVTTLAATFAALVAGWAQPAAHADENPTLDTIYDAVGSTHIGAQVDADMPLGPTCVMVTGTITPIPGQRGKNVLVSKVAYDIRLSNVQARVFGIWWPLAVGSNCHTVDPVQIDARTPEGEYFTVLAGGRVTDTYTIGSFTGCTPLNFFDIPGFFPTFGSIPINALVPGTDNTLSLTLSNPHAPA